MIYNKKNIIQTVCFDIQVPDETTATEFAEHLGAVDCQSLFSKVLSRFSDVDRSIRLDKIELDIGTIEPDDLDVLQGEIESQFEIMISRLVINSNEWSPATALTSGLKETTKEKAGDDIQLLIHYFNTGSLPWYVNDQPDIEALLLEQLDENLPAFKKALIPELKKAWVIKRIFTVTSYPTFRRLIMHLIGDSEASAFEKLELIFEKNIPQSIWPEFRDSLSTICLMVILGNGEPPEKFTRRFSNMFLHTLSRISLPALHNIHASIRKEREHNVVKELALLYNNFEEAITSITERFHPFMESTPESMIVPEVLNNGLEISDEKIYTNEKQDEIAPENEYNNPEAEEFSPQQQWFIDNAGLVLLNAALLQQNFVQLGWVEEKKIVNEVARHKMIFWMDYLVWGKRDVQEYGVLLNKILVGMEPAAVADMQIKLTADEIKAADLLLETVIGHWAILKNTGIESFRSTFLQRKGRLGNEDGGWQLFVQPKGYDVLIDSLPWSFSIIKLPWMQKPLFTQWQTRV